MWWTASLLTFSIAVGAPDPYGLMRASKKTHLEKIENVENYLNSLE